MVIVEGTDGPPTLELAARQLQIDVEDIDKSFGIVPIDPSRGLYCAQVRADRLPPGISENKRYRGPYSNPIIAPLTPPGDADKAK